MTTLLYFCVFLHSRETAQIRSVFISWWPEALVSTLRAASGSRSHMFPSPGRAQLTRHAPDKLDQVHLFPGREVLVMWDVPWAGRPWRHGSWCSCAARPGTRPRAPAAAGRPGTSDLPPSVSAPCTSGLRRCNRTRGRRVTTFFKWCGSRRLDGPSYLSVRTKFPSFMTGTLLTLLIFPNSSLNCWPNRNTQPSQTRVVLVETDRFCCFLQHILSFATPDELTSDRQLFCCCYLSRVE